MTYSGVFLMNFEVHVLVLRNVRRHFSPIQTKTKEKTPGV